MNFNTLHWNWVNPFARNLIWFRFRYYRSKTQRNRCLRQTIFAILTRIVNTIHCEECKKRLNDPLNNTFKPISIRLNDIRKNKAIENELTCERPNQLQFHFFFYRQPYIEMKCNLVFRVAQFILEKCVLFKNKIFHLLLQHFSVLLLAFATCDNFLLFNFLFREIFKPILGLFMAQ